MTLVILGIIGLCLSLIPALLYLQNIRLYRPPSVVNHPLPPVSVLIPARNESRSIRSCVEAVLSSQGIDFEVVVLDDHSSDNTAEIVAEIARLDPRVRLVHAPALPEGWCGKQHACHVLSRHARHDIFCFLDADVRLASLGLASMVSFLETSKAELVSGFPKQETGTFLEKLIIPLIHFVLLGFLPMQQMRTSNKPAFAAGCGQLFVTRRKPYESIGGHGAVRASLHDGITLPRAYRTHGYKTDICDTTDLAACRMYRCASEVWFGLAKNAREGLGSPKLLIPVTLLLIGGQVLPFVVFTLGLVGFADLIRSSTSVDMDLLMSSFQHQWIGLATCLGLLGIITAYYPRFDAAVRFRQSWWGAVWHPLGILSLLAIQWYANIRCWLGGASGWKGRSYPAAGPKA